MISMIFFGKFTEKLKMKYCEFFGHKLKWFHPQQEGCECTRCKWIIGRDCRTYLHAPF